MSAEDPGADSVVDIGAFCRAVEGHLCRVNGGHLVRIVGPAFDLVAGWAREGMPLRVVEHAVERTVARLAAKGPRRRPVRIEFCTHDVRDAFDQWRRAVGVHAASRASPSIDAAADDTSPPRGRAPSLARHVERVLLRLSSVRATRELPGGLEAAIDQAIGRTDECLEAARKARGEGRQQVSTRLQEIDDELIGVAVGVLTDDQRHRLLQQARDELASYRGRLDNDAYRAAEAALLSLLARRHFGLPQVGLDA